MSSSGSSTAREGLLGATGSLRDPQLIPTRQTSWQKPSCSVNTRADLRPACISWRNTTNSWSHSCTACASYCTRYEHCTKALQTASDTDRSIVMDFYLPKLCEFLPKVNLLIDFNCEKMFGCNTDISIYKTFISI